MLSGVLRLVRGRRAPSPRIITIAHAQVGELLFGQQHVGTQDYFRAALGQSHTVPVRDFPHYRFLAGGQGTPDRSDNPYLRYLEASWPGYFGPERNTPEARAKRLRRFVKQFEMIAASRTIAPIQVCRRPDGRMVIVDGNHRASIACKLGLDLDAEELPLKAHLRALASAPEEFYGTKRLGMPYQSIVYRGEELVEGRRKDILERMGMIAAEDIEGRTVLDLGCNLGMSCYVAAERGAAAVTGVELSPKIVRAAIRLNSFFAAPAWFIEHDLNRDLELPPFDTVFCFSIMSHVKDHSALERTLDRTTGGVLYFEGHAGTKLSNYSYLSPARFASLDLIGYTRNGIHTAARSRPLWRCEKRRPD